MEHATGDEAGTGERHSHRRYWEIDALRGCAILMMITYHFLFDLSFFHIADITVHTGFWRYFAYATAGSFVFLVGLSLTISNARRDTNRNPAPYRKYALRGGGIFLLGMGITAVTLVYPGEGYVLFGILHLIGVSIAIAPLFFGFRRLNLLAGAALFAASYAIRGIEGPLWLAWIGIHPASFVSLDYEPLIPWFGVVLIGMYAGATLYPGGLRRMPFAGDMPAAASPFAFLGRHSLAIYLVHQPLLIAGLLIAGYLTGMQVAV
ncbi:MAG: hypothetical protein APR53_05280 [Methanoculleus sp. SDB]|nr:MAG: hypothetical protein APR53_05280 [Methanoculleus sp. SDB]